MEYNNQMEKFTIFRNYAIVNCAVKNEVSDSTF